MRVVRLRLVLIMKYSARTLFIIFHLFSFLCVTARVLLPSRLGRATSLPEGGLCEPSGTPVPTYINGLPLYIIHNWLWYIIKPQGLYIIKSDTICIYARSLLFRRFASYILLCLVYHSNGHSPGRRSLQWFFSNRPRRRSVQCLCFAYYRLSIKRQAARAATAPSEVAVVTWRMALVRQSPATKTPSILLLGIQSSPAST